MKDISIIDQVYVLNLQSRQDRRDTWILLADKLILLKNKLQIFKAIDGRLVLNQTTLKPGELGCSMSHAAIWRDALKKNYKYILVFEDDVIFDAAFEQRLNDFLISCPQEFDWLYLFNSWDYRPVEPYSDKINKVISSLGTVAYILNISATSRILPYVEEYRFPIDVVMGHMSFLSNIYRPASIFVQHNDQSESDIAIKPRDSFLLKSKLKRFFKIR